MVVREIGGVRMALQCECADGDKQAPSATAPEGADADLGVRIWAGMSKALKDAIGPQSFDTWIKPIKPLWVVKDELVLQIPTVDFEHIADRYGISDYLPPALARLRVLTAKGCAA
jgi:hypothetical protein